MLSFVADNVGDVAASSVKKDAVSQASGFKWSFIHRYPEGSDPKETKSLSQGITKILNKA